MTSKTSPTSTTSKSGKGSAVPLARTPKQVAAQAKRREKARAEKELADAETAAKQQAARLAQIVNLHIAGFSLADIGASIGASADEVDRMLQNDAARYVRTQPALRTYVRNWISKHYAEMLEADLPAAKDQGHPAKLENQDRAMRILDRMAKLHGADAPTQTEVKIEAQPEAVENMVKMLAAGRGLAYADDVFDEPLDVVDAEVIEDGTAALDEVSRNEAADDEAHAQDGESL